MSDKDVYSFTAHLVVMANKRNKGQAADDILETMLDHDIACSLHDTDKQADEIERLREALERIACFHHEPNKASEYLQEIAREALRDD